MDFKTWIDHKKVKDTDLAFTKTLPAASLGLFSEIAGKMAAHNPSFSDGIAFLEKITDLLHLGHQETLLQKTSHFPSWKDEIHKLRYPITAVRDQQLRGRMEQLPWPYGAKLKFERRGDRAGMELKVFISSSSDITKIISSLEHVRAEMQR